MSTNKKKSKFVLDAPTFVNEAFPVHSTTSSAYLPFSINYEWNAKICPQQTNTDSHENLPKGKQKRKRIYDFTKFTVFVPI